MNEDLGEESATSALLMSDLSLRHITLRDKIGGGHASLTYEPYLTVRANGLQPPDHYEVVEELATKVLA